MWFKFLVFVNNKFFKEDYIIVIMKRGVDVLLILFVMIFSVSFVLGDAARDFTGTYMAGSETGEGYEIGEVVNIRFSNIGNQNIGPFSIEITNLESEEVVFELFSTAIVSPNSSALVFPWYQEDNNGVQVEAGIYKVQLDSGIIKSSQWLTINSEKALGSIYPLPFIFGDSVDVAVIYGTASGVSVLETIAAGNIQSDLNSRTSVEFGDLLVKDNELDSVSSKNLIVVGALEICSNSVIGKIVGEVNCDSIKSKLGIDSGQFLIQSFENPWQSGKIVLLVVGYEVTGLVEAISYLRANTINTTAGSKYIGNPNIEDEDEDEDEGSSCEVHEFGQKMCSYQETNYVIRRNLQCNLEVFYSEVKEIFELPMLSQKILKNGVIIKNPSPCSAETLKLTFIGNEMEEIIPDDGTGPIDFPVENQTEFFCNGCLLEEICYPLGYRKSGQFCSDSFEFIDQSKAGSVCENNFECGSNVCVSGECVSQSLIQKIIDFFRRLFGGS